MVPMSSLCSAIDMEAGFFEKTQLLSGNCVVITIDSLEKNFRLKITKLVFLHKFQK